MKIIEIKRDHRRWTVNRYIRRLGEVEFDNRYLIRQVTLRLFGIPIWAWAEDVRVIPVHEWALNVFGDHSYPDEYPCDRLEGRYPS